MVEEGLSIGMGEKNMNNLILKIVKEENECTCTSNAFEVAIDPTANEDEDEA